MPLRILKIIPKALLLAMSNKIMRYSITKIPLILSKRKAKSFKFHQTSTNKIPSQVSVIDYGIRHHAFLGSDQKSYKFEIKNLLLSMSEKKNSLSKHKRDHS